MGEDSLEERVRALLSTGAHERAATEAIRELGPRALRYVRMIVRGEADAEDAFSLWAEGVWKGLPGFRGEAPLLAWALRLAHHSALAVVGQPWRRRARPFVSGEASRLAKSIRTATAVRLDRQREQLERLTARLTPADRALLSLRIDQRLSWEDIAEVLSSETGALSPRGVAKRYERVKARLAAAVGQEDE